MKNPEDEALDRILGDMDGMESGRMFGQKPGDASKGVSITISVVPKGEDGGDGDGDDYPEGHDAAMCGGGCAMHKMNAGGRVTDPGLIDDEKDLAGNQPHKFAAGGVVEDPVDDDSKLPPFLRKKKKPLQDA